MAKFHRFLFANWAYSHRCLVVPAVCCLIAAVGCNSQPPGQNQASSPPKLSMAAEQGSDSSTPAVNSASDAQGGTNNTGAAPAAADQSGKSNEADDPALKSALGDLETNAKAWQEGRSFDFAPVRRKSANG